MTTNSVRHLCLIYSQKTCNLNTLYYNKTSGSYYMALYVLKGRCRNIALISETSNSVLYYLQAQKLDSFTQEGLDTYFFISEIS